MSGIVLIVDKDDSRRARLRRAFSFQRMGYVEAVDSFHAMSALGRADFKAVIVVDEKRLMTVRSMFALANKRHPGIKLVMLAAGAFDLDGLRKTVNLDVAVFPAELGVDEVASQVRALIEGHPQEEEDVSLDDEAPAPPPSPLPPLPQRPALIVEEVVDDSVVVEEDVPVAAQAVDELEVDVEIASPPKAADALFDSAPIPKSSEQFGDPFDAALEEESLEHNDMAGGTDLDDLFDEPPAAQAPEAPLDVAPPVDASANDAGVDVARTPVPLGEADAPPWSAGDGAEAAGAGAGSDVASLRPEMFDAAPPMQADLPPPAVEAHADVSLAPDGALPLEPVVEAAPPVGEEPLPLLEGSFEDGCAPALFVALFSQGLTGRLSVQDSSGEGTMFFLSGEPVWADDPSGDAGMFQRVRRNGLIPDDTPMPEVLPGQMLTALAQAGLISGEAVHQLMLGFVRDRVLVLCTENNGYYRFYEDRSFLDVTPLFKLNPLGMVIESRRRMMTPDRLLAEGFEMENKYVLPGPGLRVAAPKLAPFARGKDLAAIIDGASTVGDFCQKSGLDVLMGTLIIMVLLDAHLAFLSDSARVHEESEVELDFDIADATEELLAPELVDDFEEVGPAPEDTPAMAAAREGLLLLYMRLKPLTSPDHVLGLSDGISDDTVDSAYSQLMGTLESYAATGICSDPVLGSRVDELKRKVLAAWQALRAPGAPTAV